MNINESWYGPACYQIKVTGRLGDQWSDWFDGMTLLYSKGITTITGEIMDQAALHGVLIKVRDLGLALVSVNRIGPGTDEICCSDKKKRQK